MPFLLSRPRSYILIVVSCLLAVRAEAAQEPATPVVIGETLEFESQILNENRQVIVSRPAGYDLGTDRYPVVYLLDGEEHFLHTTGLATFLADNIRIPEVIVVGIVNTDRTRDLTPPSQDEQEIESNPTHGGAQNFLSFIVDELSPWVEKNYRTLPDRILVGHSYGGLFTVYALVNEPTAFDSYIAISPSLGWNNQRLVSELEALFDRTPQFDADLFMTAGNEDDSTLGSIQELSGILDEKAPVDFRWAFNLMENESHQLVPHRSIHQGLEFIYYNYYLADPMTFFDENGIQGLVDYYAETGRKIPLITYANLMNPLMGTNSLDEMAALLSQGPEAYDPVLPSVFIQGWNMLADRYKESSNEARAIEFYRRVLDADSSNERARNGLREIGVEPGFN